MLMIRPPPCPIISRAARCKQKNTLAMPKAAEPWSLTSLREKLIKIGAKVVSHGRYVTFQMAERMVAIRRSAGGGQGHDQTDCSERRLFHGCFLPFVLLRHSARSLNPCFSRWKRSTLLITTPPSGS